jgi:hypothetical protein
VLEKHTGRDTLDSSTTSKTTDSRLGDSLDVVTENLAVTLGTTLSETLSSLSAYVYVSALLLKCYASRQLTSSHFVCG